MLALKAKAFNEHPGSILYYADGIPQPAQGVITDYDRMSYQENLEIGQFWENVLVVALRANGVDCYRPLQDFREISTSCLQGIRQPSRRRTIKDLTAFTEFQRDILIRVPASCRRLSLEVKSRVSPFKYPTVDVGKTEGWEAKKFPVSFLAVICQLSGETRFVHADSLNREALWHRRRNRDKGDCYSVPRQALTALEPSLDAIRAILEDHQ